MKKIVTAVILIVIVLGVAPLGFGFWADNRVNEALEQISASGELSHRVIKSRRGWFSSNYEIVIEVTGEAADRFRSYQHEALADKVRPLSIKLRNTVYHGPLPFAAGSGASMAEALATPALATIDTRIIALAGEDLEQQDPAAGIPYSIVTQLDFVGGGTTYVDIPPLQRTVNDGQTTVDWQGLQGELNYDTGSRRTVAEFLANGFVIEDGKGRLESGAWSMSADMTEVVEHIAVGKASFTIALLDFSSREQPGKGFNMQGFSVSSSSEADAEVLHSRVDMELKKISAEGKQYGPGVLSISLRNLDIEAVSSINKQLKQLQSQGVPQEQMGMMMGATMLSNLPRILQRQPELEIVKLTLDTGKGMVSGTGKITVDGSDPAVLANPMMLKEALVADVSLQIPEPVLLAMQVAQLEKELVASGMYSGEQVASIAASQAQKKIDALVANHMLEKGEGQYSFTASILNGEVTVNGRILELSEAGSM